MRRFGLLGLVLLLSGCAGFGDFLSDTITTSGNPNRPFGNSLNMRRVMGDETRVEPLAPEPGDVWPKRMLAIPTLQSLERQQDIRETTPPPADRAPFLPDHRQPRPEDLQRPPGQSRGSSTPPGSVQPGLAPPPAALPAPQPPASVGPPPPPDLTGRSFQTPQGTGVIGGGTQNFQTFTSPQGGGIIVPNNDGTSTVIRPDGSVTTIPTPR